MFRAKPGDIIRHVESRHPYLVIAKNAQGIMVVDLFLKTDPARVEIILHRAMEHFEPDIKIIDLSEDEAKRIEEQLPLVEDVIKSYQKK